MTLSGPDKWLPSEVAPDSGTPSACDEFIGLEPSTASFIISPFPQMENNYKPAALFQSILASLQMTYFCIATD